MKLLLVALFASTLSFSTGAFAFSGVSGGGGNVMFPVDPKDRATVAEVQAAVVRAKPKLEAYFQSKLTQYDRGELSREDEAVFGTLFQAKKPITKVARGTGMDIEEDHPCFDAGRNPVDGSIYSERRDSICVSSFSISRKVERKDVSAQSAALVAHELTEVLGFEEADAVRVQARVLDDFRRNAQ